MGVKLLHCNIFLKVHTMFTNTPFEAIAKSMSASAPQFDQAAVQASMKSVQDNLKAWGDLAQAQAQAAQASLTQTMESFKTVKEPQAAAEVLKASAESSLALATKNLKDATALSVAQFKASVEAIEKAHPAPETFATVAQSLKAASSAVETALDAALKNSASVVASATPAKKGK